MIHDIVESAGIAQKMGCCFCSARVYVNIAFIFVAWQRHGLVVVIRVVAEWLVCFCKWTGIDHVAKRFVIAAAARVCHIRIGTQQHAQVAIRNSCRCHLCRRPGRYCKRSTGVKFRKSAVSLLRLPTCRDKTVIWIQWQVGGDALKWFGIIVVVSNLLIHWYSYQNSIARTRRPDLGTRRWSCDNIGGILRRLDLIDRYFEYELEVTILQGRQGKYDFLADDIFYSKCSSNRSWTCPFRFPPSSRNYRTLKQI